MLTFEEKLDRYAELLVTHGLNVQRGQVVQINGATCHRDIIQRAAKAAYKRGAKYVQVDFMDERISKLRLEMSQESDLDYIPSYLPLKFQSLVDEKAAVLTFLGLEDPDLFSQVDSKKMNALQTARRRAMKVFYEVGVGHSKVHWTLGAAATPLWGKKLFPELSLEEAEMKLWDHIFSICRVDQPDCLQAWKEHNTQLQKRSEYLTKLKIKELHFKGPGTDLIVELSPKAKWVGGTSEGPYGVDFEPNIPTEECFTTPDYRKTRGKVTATRPFYIHGQLIKGLMMEFEHGELVRFTAKEGESAFKAYIQTDEGAKRLGEVALVGIDSPVYQSGVVFNEILFDENAACHIAIGRAYVFALQEGPSLAEEELDKLGCNNSVVHTDMMISSEKVDVEATTYDGKTLPLLKNGAWI